MEVSAQESVIIKYVTDLKNIHNETARKERFVVLLCELFPDHRDYIGKFAGGAESYLSVQLENGESKRGFVDTLFGNLVIEFEHELPKMLQIAKGQLMGYVAQLWSDRENYTPYLCIATDGLSWHVYSPRIKLSSVDALPLQPEHIELIESESFNLADRANVPLFRGWIDRILFRENSIKPDGKIIATEYGQNGHVFVRAMSRLELVVQYVRETPQFKVAFENWGRYLRYTYGELVANPDLFLRHSYMSAFSKLLVASMFSKKIGKKITADNILDVITGDFFANLRVQNYCERDFFGWLNTEEVSDDLRDLWFSIFNSLAIYDFNEVENDFLKDIYQELVDPEDRHDLGEYYTPDWLCERLVSQMLRGKTDNPKIADITCGSGSFLRAAIVQLREKSPKSEGHEECLSRIVNSVYGFEIHPLAVFIAKTNYLIAINDLVVKSKRQISIPVYLCDSLLSPQDNVDLFTVNNIRFKIGDSTIEIPKSISNDAQVLIEFIDYCEQVAQLTVGSATKVDSPGQRDQIKSFLKKRKHECTEDVIDSAVHLIQTLRDKKQRKEDSIWAYILKNNLQPYLFKNFFDVIVGNPPWLSFRYISDESYRKEIEWLGMEKYKVAPRTSSLRTQMELATVFMAHACGYYLNKKGSVGFVMPRSIFSADHHAPFRETSCLNGMEISEIWDLMDVRPLFNVPTCVIIAGEAKAGRKVDSDHSVNKGELNDGHPKKAGSGKEKSGRESQRRKAG
jgi:hypothetical protein